jgi:23S rRNA pseudouridine1911/1915/1917 synthase
MKRRAYSVTSAEAGTTLEAFLAPKHDNAPELISGGATYYNGKRCKNPTQRLSSDDRIMVVLEEGGRTLEQPPAQLAPLEILFEDSDVIVINKPAGTFSQPTPGNTGPNVHDQVTHYLKSPATLAHRLDRETTGIMILGKTRESGAALMREFREGRARKRYVAIVDAELPKSGVIKLGLTKDPTRVGRFRAVENGRTTALTYFETNGKIVTLYPKTGRTHQLRAHLTALGAPIVGDKLYGGAKAERCLLHAQALEIFGRLYEAPIPQDMAAFMKGTPAPSGPIKYSNAE